MATEIRKATAVDIEFGTGNATSAGGHVGARINASHLPVVLGDDGLSVNDALTAWVDVRAYGASPGAGAGANVTAFQDALDAINAAGGGTLRVPPGTYNLNAAINVYKKTTIKGMGRKATYLMFTHAGDGIKSTWPINSSTAVDIVLRDIAIYTNNAGSTGGGFVDVGGTFVHIIGCSFSGWKYGVIFDQTEVSHIDRTEFIVLIAGGTGIWLVNGNDHTALADPRYTNQITITRNQLNAVAGAYNVIDDGGATHDFIGNNFNAGLIAVRFAGTAGFRFQGNEVEGHSLCGIDFSSTTFWGGDDVGDSGGGIISGNVMITGAPSQILLDYVHGVSIEGNYFGQASSAEIMLKNGGSNRATDVTIRNNMKLIWGPAKSTQPFIDGSSVPISRQSVDQMAATYVPSALGATGLQTISPTSRELINVGTRLFVVNADGTNGEDVLVSAVAGGTFTATFASVKAANWLVYGRREVESGTWTPVLSGDSVAGAHTYHVQSGFYYKNKNFVHVQAYIRLNALDGAMAGKLRFGPLPFVPSITSNFYAIGTIGYYTGLTFPAGFTQLTGMIAAGSNVLDLWRNGSASASAKVDTAEISGGLEFIFDARYLTHE